MQSHGSKFRKKGKRCCWSGRYDLERRLSNLTALHLTRSRRRCLRLGTGTHRHAQTDAHVENIKLSVAHRMDEGGITISCTWDECEKQKEISIKIKHIKTKISRGKLLFVLFRTDSTDSPDCLPILLSISFLVFSFPPLFKVLVSYGRLSQLFSTR